MTNDQEKRSRDRAETAREHDDSDLIDDNLDTPHQGGRSGGNLATDVGTQAAEERVSDPEAHEGVDKADDIAHGEAYASDRTPDR
jgi:hypothetical protein